MENTEKVIEKGISNCRRAAMIFSSYGFRSPIMRAKFAKVIPRDNRLCEKTCLLVPYAGYNLEKTIEAELGGLVEFGFSKDNVYPLRPKPSDELMDRSFDYIYVPGGDPFKLMFGIKSNGMLSNIRHRVLEQKAVYIGVSAGACVASPNIEYVNQLEDDNILFGEYEALGILPQTIICHSDHFTYKQIQSCKDISGGSIITIRDDQLVLYEDGCWEYVEE